ncbi:MAG TPA: hypothetical protein VFE08_14500 [Candidatus Sulfotelmatobacter sp.]|jgi:hypothetical protein|nr:hypothetical protein [Candidatus Sulfotelmatobacter sp.]
MRQDYSDMTQDLWNYMVLDEFGYIKPLNRQHLPFFSEMGAYTIVYLTEQGNELCADCATRALYLLDDESDPPIASGTYDEGPVIQCDDCNRDIESSYGDPEEK